MQTKSNSSGFCGEGIVLSADFTRANYCLGQPAGLILYANFTVPDYRVGTKHIQIFFADFVSGGYFKKG